MAGGMPVDDELKAELPEKFTLPALAPFPTGGNVLLKADGPGKEQAVDALQALTLRFITQLPAGKARLTMFDPVGLGDNFAALMHLADYDEALIAHRIWTEEHHFETRLVDLTGHMESIIQKYLRNQYQSIEAYNEDAGEVAEPFRLLVVANYPANFNTEAAKRLMSVSASGARCGVAFISMDVSANQPRDINQSLLEENSLVLEYRDGGFHFTDPDYAGLPLTLATPPDDKKTTELLNKVGQAAKDAAKVEVAFKLVHPQHEQKSLWYADSANGLNIPLGRVGATRRQSLTLGQGLPSTFWLQVRPVRVNRHCSMCSSPMPHSITAPNNWRCASSISRRVWSSKPTLHTPCLMPVWWLSKANGSLAFRCCRSSMPN